MSGSTAHLLAASIIHLLIWRGIIQVGVARA
jgi:hypothetical protein